MSLEAVVEGTAAHSFRVGDDSGVERLQSTLQRYRGPIPWIYPFQTATCPGWALAGQVTLLIDRPPAAVRFDTTRTCNPAQTGHYTILAAMGKGGSPPHVELHYRITGTIGEALSR